MSEKEDPFTYRKIISNGISYNIEKNNKISEILSVILNKLDKIFPPKNSTLN